MFASPMCLCVSSGRRRCTNFGAGLLHIIFKFAFSKIKEAAERVEGRKTRLGVGGNGRVKETNIVSMIEISFSKGRIVLRCSAILVAITRKMMMETRGERGSSQSICLHVSLFVAPDVSLCKLGKLFDSQNYFRLLM